jgi:hypothetical protein
MAPKKRDKYLVRVFPRVRGGELHRCAAIRRASGPGQSAHGWGSNSTDFYPANERGKHTRQQQATSANLFTDSHTDLDGRSRRWLVPNTHSHTDCAW